MKKSEFTISGEETIHKLLTVLHNIAKRGYGEGVSLHAKFQKEGSMDLPSKQPNKAVVIYEDDEESTPTSFDNIEDACFYLSFIDKDPYKIQVKIKGKGDKNPK